MSKVIIAIHGLGNKPTKELLKEWWLTAIHEGLYREGHTDIELPTFELIYWADILYVYPLTEKIRHKSDPYHLEEVYTPSPLHFKKEDHTTRQKVIHFLNNQINELFLNEDFTLNYSYLTDKILHNFFEELEIYFTEKCTIEDNYKCEAKHLIQKRVIETIKKYEGDEIMLIGHSMGSIIAYDVLSYMIPETKIDTFITMGSPLGLPIVMSKLAGQYKNHSATKVEMMRTPRAIQKNWFNFSDILDKVAFNYELSDDFTTNDNGIKPIDFLVTNTYTIHGEQNPHKSYGYLRTPEFTKVLVDFIQSEETSNNQIIDTLNPSHA